MISIMVLLTGVASDATVKPLERAIVSVDGGVEGTAAGVGSSTPGRGSVRGTLNLDDPPKSLEKKAPAELAVSVMAGRALA
jgi:hypothetical protein